jgi:RNA polymerase sigma-70 factor (ECF subfamily)
VPPLFISIFFGLLFFLTCSCYDKNKKMDELKTIDREKELVSRLTDGDREAFGELYDIYAPKLFRFIRLKVGSQVLAEDLSSESFLRIWEYFKDAEREIEETFQALLYKIAHNLIADYYKRKSSQEILINDDFNVFIEGQIAPSEVSLKEDTEEIHRALVGMKEEYQNVILWYYVDELPVLEIAKLMDKSEGAIRVLIHRALTSLKKILAEKGE